MKIEIDVDTSKQEIVIKDDAGNERSVKSILIVGGDAASKSFYLFGWGSSADAGWALAHSLRATADPFYKKVFTHFMQWIATWMGFLLHEAEQADAEEILKRWDEEDKSNKPTYN